MRLFRLSPRAILCVAPTLVAFSALACSSAHDESQGTSTALVINPIGNEDESDVTLQLPTDACLPGATCAKILGQAPGLYIDGTSVALGASTRLIPGSHNVTVNNTSWQLTTTAGQVVSITLPVADTKCTNAVLPNIPVTNFGGKVSVSNAACPVVAQGPAVGVTTPANLASPASELYYYAGCQANYALSPQILAYTCSKAPAYEIYYLNIAGVCVSTGVGSVGCLAAQAVGTTPLTPTYEAYAPGTLTATVNGTAQTLTLTPGQETDFNISLPALGTVPATFATDITFLNPRANPDAAQGTITSSCSGDTTYTIPSATGTPAPLALTAFVNSGCTYTLNVGGRTQVLSQTTTNAIGLSRLDVNNVTITRQDLDGGTYTVVGQYSLNYGGVQVAGPYNTGTGIDVLPGTYEFSLTYTDFDGPQTQTQTLIF